jgi:serine/threonine-protein kinase
VWRANLSAGGRPVEVTNTFNADGTSKFVVKDRQGRRAASQGTWQYSEGMLYQTFANGASGKGSIEWIDDDTFEVTIIDNGVPADSGQKRRYHRLHGVITPLSQQRPKLKTPLPAQ